MKTRMLLWACCLPLSCYALQFGAGSSPAVLAIGDCVTAFFPDSCSFAFGNACTGMQSKPSLQAQYSNHFFLPELGRSDLSLVYPTRAITVSSSLSYYGLDYYGEYGVGIAFSRWFKPYVSFSVGVEYVGLYLSPQTGILHSGQLQAAIAVFPIPSLMIQVQVYNLSFSHFRLAEQQWRIPSVFRLGLSYQWGKQVTLSVEASKELEAPFKIGGGVQYRPIRSFCVRLGLYGQRSLVPTLGVGLRFVVFACDIGFGYDLVLGLKGAVGLRFMLRK